jgi:chromosome segregation ATPase
LLFSLFFRVWSAGESGQRSEPSSKPVQSGFAAIAEDIADIKSTMATKSGVRAIVADELRPIKSEVNQIRLELATIRRDLDDLSRKIENVTRYRKEIHHALERITAIEKHLYLKSHARAK